MGKEEQDAKGGEERVRGFGFVWDVYVLIRGHQACTDLPWRRNLFLRFLENEIDRRLLRVLDWKTFCR